ncbi:MAG: hypothetical protein AAF231_02340 [Pseudomonadota bacterium]
MSFNHYVPGKTNPHLPHDGLELQSIPASAEDIELAKSDADDLVSQLMEGTLPLPTPKDERASDQGTPQRQAFKPVSRPISRPVSKPATAHPLFRAAEPVVPAEKTETPEVKPTRPNAGTPIELCEETLVNQVLKDAFPTLKEQPKTDPRREMAQEAVGAVAGRVGLFVGLVVTGAMCVFWPLQAIGLLLLAISMFVVTMLLLNVPFVARRLHKRWARYAQRSPERAERVRVAADATAGVIEQVLDHLPGGLADRLAMPDFSKPVAPKR